MVDLTGSSPLAAREASRRVAEHSQRPPTT
jgi:hypothetical protein